MFLFFKLRKGKENGQKSRTVLFPRQTLTWCESSGCWRSCKAPSSSDTTAAAPLWRKSLRVRTRRRFRSELKRRLGRTEGERFCSRSSFLENETETKRSPRWRIHMLLFWKMFWCCHRKAAKNDRRGSRGKLGWFKLGWSDQLWHEIQKDLVSSEISLQLIS